jgi:hypothetical protein
MPVHEVLEGMGKHMRVCVQGTWRLGPVTTPCLAAVGLQVAEGIRSDRKVRFRFDFEGAKVVLSS